MRQLSYESLTIAVAAIRQRVEAPDDLHRKLPPQEKDARLKRMQASITGFQITGVFEPAHCVIDSYAQMVEEGVIRIVPLGKCISREQELQSVKHEKAVITLENQQLHVKNRELDATTDISTELKVYQAFTRRGLALEMAGLASYSVHERVTRELMTHLSRDPPPNFRAPTLEAVLRADKHLWIKVADHVKSNLRLDENGKLPVDKALTSFYMQADVLFHLMPTHQAGAASSKASKRSASPQQTAREAPPRPAKGLKPKFSKTRAKMPSGLHGFKPSNAKGQRICYNFNLPHGCSQNVQKDGSFEKCSRGVHQCIKCHAGHAYASCPKKQN